MQSAFQMLPSVFPVARDSEYRIHLFGICLQEPLHPLKRNEKNECEREEEQKGEEEEKEEEKEEEDERGPSALHARKTTGVRERERKKEII